MRNSHRSSNLGGKKMHVVEYLNMYCIQNPQCEKYQSYFLNFFKKRRPAEEKYCGSRRSCTLLSIRTRSQIVYRSLKMKSIKKKTADLLTSAVILLCMKSITNHHHDSVRQHNHPQDQDTRRTLHHRQYPKHIHQLKLRQLLLCLDHPLS